MGGNTGISINQGDAITAEVQPICTELEKAANAPLKPNASNPVVSSFDYKRGANNAKGINVKDSSFEPFGEMLKNVIDERTVTLTSPQRLLVSGNVPKLKENNPASPVRNGGKANLCDGDEGTHEIDGDKSYYNTRDKVVNRHATHTEAKYLSILGHAGLLQGAEITFFTNWPNPPAGTSMRSPCPVCFDMILTAVQNCGAKINICDEKGSPLSLMEDKDNPYASFDEAYADLQKKLSGSA